MRVGFLSVIHGQLVWGCEYKETCVLFQRCFDSDIPCELWRSLTCFDNLIKYVNDWREFQK